MQNLGLPPQEEYLANKELSEYSETHCECGGELETHVEHLGFPENPFDEVVHVCSDCNTVYLG